MTALLGPAQRVFGLPPLFDPGAGTTVRAPLAGGPGWWAGAPGAYHDAGPSRVYLSYRMRRPRELGRGGETRVAVSADGLDFDDVWRAEKAAFEAESIERCALVRAPGGAWRLYVSFVDAADRRWRIEVLEAGRIEDLDPAARRPVLAATDIDGEGVKDPYVFLLGGRWYMLASYAPRPPTPDPAAAGRLHATADVYATGIVKSLTGLASSHDGLHWQWEGPVLVPPASGWDAYATRLGAFLYLPPVFAGFYDGSASVVENYEERTGLAVSLDLRRWDRVSVDGPALVSPHASGSLRYLDALPLDDAILYYYEYAREDGSHELRVNRVERP
jgi:hypothetical protein